MMSFDREYWGEEYVKIVNSEVLQDDAQVLILKADIEGSIEEAIAQVYEEERKDIWINGKSMRDFPNLIIRYKPDFDLKDAKKMKD